MAAAEADFKPLKLQKQKIKKNREGLDLKLVPTVDILKALSKKKGKKIFVGFALETCDLIKNAMLKLREKKLDMIVVNQPSAFGSDQNKVIIIKHGKAPDTTPLLKRYPLMSKKEIASIILKDISTLLK
jgi:phosphopantothenoylcysteine synthetase/decarboxylase